VESAPEDALVWHANGTGLWNWYPPEGGNVLVLQGGGESAAVSQTLKAALQPNTRYELSVWAGQRMDQAKLPWPHVAVALYAGDMLLKSQDVPEPTITPAYGVWVQNLLVFTSPPNVPRGQRVRITITRAGSGGAQACFDRVALRCSTVPGRG